MHILFAATLPPPLHGQAYITQRVLEALQKTGTPISIWDLSPATLRRGPVYHVRRLARVVRAAAGMLWQRLRNTGRPLVFYGVVESRFGIVYNYLLVAVARLIGCRIFLHHHTAAHTKATQPRFAALVRLAPNATHVALSEEMKTDLQARYPEIGEIVVSDNTCHLQMPPAPSRTAHKGPLRLGMLSNLTVEKGAILAIETAIEAHRQGLDVTLTLAGPVMDEAVANAIQAAQVILLERLIVPGPLYGEAKMTFFRNVDVFLFPTQYANEAQPLVLLEAMSQGCVFISYGRGYIPELITEDGGLCINTNMKYTDEAVAWMKRYLKAGYEPSDATQRFQMMVKASLKRFKALLDDLES